MPNEWPFEHIPENSPAGALIQALVKTGTPPLVPRTPRDKSLKKSLDAMSLKELFGEAEIGDTNFADAVKCGLYLWNDCLDESHRISQTIETPTGSYWHGIMHRREPDYGNSKYWFRRAGSHEAYPAVLASAKGIAGTMLDLGEAWDPFRMVDLCEEAARTGDREMEAQLEKVQLAEIRVLLDFSFGMAVGQ